MITIGTKAETLDRLTGVLTTACVLPQVRFTVAEWRTGQPAVLDRLRVWADRPVVVRSSALTEDGRDSSLAGRFASVLHVTGLRALAEAVETVITSYDGDGALDQVFVQPMLEGVRMSGVGFTRDAGTGSPYFVINYDATSGRTDTVTGGAAETRTYYAFEQAAVTPGEPFAGVIALARELQQLLGMASIDFEFAVTSDDTVYLLQARPLTLAPSSSVPTESIAQVLERVERKVAAGQAPHPYLYGGRTVYGVMPDWNPAEIIGVRPKPLALSLYKDVITDSVWAYQRHNYGYKNLRSFPLLVSFGGLPYIDVRVSFNSFLPADVTPDLSERLVNYYIDSLVAYPSHHDKVEFEIVYSCYTLDLPERMARLRAHGFSAADCESLTGSLRALTNSIIHPDTGLWLRDIEKIRQLESRRQVITASHLDPLARIYWLIEDCKRYGTLPFVGLARAAFIAVQLLRSLVQVGILNEHEFSRFMSSLTTVGSRLPVDFRTLDREAFLERYGHLRPGTYDIESPRYDEAPDRYFDWSRRSPPEPDTEPPFVISIDQLNRTKRLLEQHQLGHDAIGLFNFIKSAIEGREYAKFIFTQSLSDALQALQATAVSYGLSPEDCAYLDYSCVQQLYASSADPATTLAESAAAGRRAHAISRQITLPPLLVRPADVWAFEVPPSEPNFITMGRAEGPLAFAADGRDHLAGSIVMIPSADPGYDWIFSHDIRGFITMWGGANSHMAVRAAELGMPAVIGAGEALFQSWARASVLSVDCANRMVRVVR